MKSLLSESPHDASKHIEELPKQISTEELKSES